MSDSLSAAIEELPAAARARLLELLTRECGRAPEAALVAFVEVEAGAPPPEDLRRQLAEQLPDYMVPAAIVPLDELPRTATGKVDRRRLPLVVPESSRAPADGAGSGAPGRAGPAHEQGDVERTLSEIWSEVLGVDDIGPDEDFFELGGDSILSIRIIARANAAGIRITARQFMDAPTLSRLSAVVETGAVAPGEGPSPASAAAAAVPLLPIQHWFFEHVTIDRNRWNQALVLALEASIGDADIESALAHVVDRHDALRMRFREGPGGWTATSAGDATPPALERVELVASSGARSADGELEAAVEALEARLHDRLDIAAGPLLAAGRVVAGDGASRLVVVVHHLAVDAMSLEVLREDVASAVLAITGGRSPRLEAPGISYARWARAVADGASEAGGAEGARYWLEEGERVVPALPVDRHASPAENLRGGEGRRVLSLDADRTARLVERARSLRTSPRDVLLSALLVALEPWTRSRLLRVDLEGHGRDVVPGLDASRTVGWFTTVFPVVLELDPGAPLDVLLRGTTEQLRAVPNAGASHGVHRYLSPDPRVRERLARMKRPEILLNYLGRADEAIGVPSSVRFVRGATASARSPRAVRPYLFEIDARIAHGRLHVDWVYGTSHHEPSTVDRLASAFERALDDFAAFTGEPAQGAAPSDFPLAGLDQAALDRLASLLDDADGDRGDGS